ncbi:MAG: conserved membrane protein of unknown function [Promethearchaeota archaeon]|nr:MAG: conserved membrane protein of unknown function [Candidatus Lokiarchaeota archaeon]
MRKIKREIVSENIRIFGGVFFIAIVPLELINFIFVLFSDFKINGSTTKIINILLYYEYGPAFSLMIWFFLLVLIMFFWILGFYFLKFAKNPLDSKNYSKHLFLIGAILITLTFIKLYMLYLIERGILILDNTQIGFEQALLDFNFTPIYTYYMWRILPICDCYRIMVGIVMGAIGLYWLSVQEKEEKSKKELKTDQSKILQ